MLVETHNSFEPEVAHRLRHRLVLNNHRNLTTQWPHRLRRLALLLGTIVYISTLFYRSRCETSLPALVLVGTARCKRKMSPRESQLHIGQRLRFVDYRPKYVEMLPWCLTMTVLVPAPSKTDLNRQQELAWGYSYKCKRLACFVSPKSVRITEAIEKVILLLGTGSCSRVADDLFDDLPCASIQVAGDGKWSRAASGRLSTWCPCGREWPNWLGGNWLLTELPSLSSMQAGLSNEDNVKKSNSVFHPLQ